MSFGENLREAMNISKITTKELADKTGINENTISSYLKTNASIPTADKAVKIAKALNTSVEFLTEGFETDFYKMRHSSRCVNAIASLENLPKETRDPILKMISEMSQKFSSS